MRKHLKRVFEFVQLSIFALSAFVGLAIGVLDVVGIHDAWTGKIPAISLSLLGLISLSLVFERIILMKRLESLEALETEELIRSLPKDQQVPIRQVVQDCVELHRMKENLKSSDHSFFDVANEIIAEQYLIFKALSQGKVSVPYEMTAIAQRKLISRFRESFEAVSEEDLSFWMGPDSRDYFEAGAAAIRRGTSVNRIFVFTVAELFSRQTDIVNVLERQHLVGIGWGVAISEELDPQVRDVALPLDFAIFDRGKAVSFFRKRDERRFEATFNLPNNSQKVANQRMIYRFLVAECWLANQKFKDSFSGGMSSEEKAAIETRAAMSNQRLEEMGIGIEKNAAPFVCLVSDHHEIAAKVRTLATIIREWRGRRGVDLPITSDLKGGTAEATSTLR